MYQLYTLLAFLSISLILYVIVSYETNRSLLALEASIRDIFLQKIAKIPAIIEVMRPLVVDEHLAFDLVTELHSEALLYNYTSVPMLLEHNNRINDQYAFLMRLSMAIPPLQRDAYFIYIRGFVMSYDKIVKDHIPVYNQLVKKWNRCVTLKNYTLIGYFFPMHERIEV